MSAPYAQSTIDELTRRLEWRRASVEQRAVTSRSNATSALEDLDRSDLLDGDAPDAGSGDVERNVALALSQLSAANAAAVDVALERIAAGTYGACDDCGRRIPLARLRALPETTVCVDCRRAAIQLQARAW
jgi:RNA polymerase-binding transcription factor DksA